MRKTCLLLGALGCMQAGDSTTGLGDIWDHDDREETYQLGGPLADSARASVALLPTSGITSVEDAYAVAGTTLLEEQRLCDGQRFAEQPTPMDCSGTLVAPDIVLTAHHCFDDTPCNQISVVFDFAYDAAQIGDPISVTSIPMQNVYRCIEVLAEDAFPTEENEDALERRSVQGSTAAGECDLLGG